MSKKPPTRHAWQLRPAPSGVMSDRKCTVCGMTMGEAMAANATVCFRADSIEHEPQKHHGAMLSILKLPKHKVVPMPQRRDPELERIKDHSTLPREVLDNFERVVMDDLKRNYGQPFDTGMLSAEELQRVLDEVKEIKP